LERRFQPVQVNEPSVDDTISILRGVKEKYEAHHGIRIADAALVAGANLSVRYITERRLPDKAIDLMDEAGSKLRIKTMTAPPGVQEVEDRLKSVRTEKEASIEAQEFEKAASLRDEEKKIIAEKRELIESWKSPAGRPLARVTEEEIADIVSMWTGIPVVQLTEEETRKLLRMEDELHKRVVGQDEAIGAVSRAIRRSRAGIKNPRRPTGSFIFLGPSGVGKTELAKTLAEFLFGSEDALIQIDMSEYMEKHTVSRMVGSPPGYVGYDEGGQLSEAVRRRPYSVVLFDEIEKAHPDVMNVLLQIMEDGHLTDAQGRKVDFKNVIVIMTSNVGAAFIANKTPLGFQQSTDDGSLSYDVMKERITGELKRHFKPEFLNRLDDVIVFHELTHDQVLVIVDKLFDRLVKQLHAQNLTASLTDEAKELLSTEGFEPSMGARPLRRALQRLVEDQLSDAILSGDYCCGDEVVVGVEDGKIVFRHADEAHTVGAEL
jgi:ATP-dependent Clp protease ATP-binding subunit ClpC